MRRTRTPVVESYDLDFGRTGGRSLQSITGLKADPGPHATYLISRCETLWGTRVSDFSVEDFRIMIGQQIRPDILMPVALQVLSKNPIAMGDFFPGDLLCAVLRNEDWIAANPEDRQTIAEICEAALVELKADEWSDHPETCAQIEGFLRK